MNDAAALGSSPGRGLAAGGQFADRCAVTEHGDGSPGKVGQCQVVGVDPQVVVDRGQEIVSTDNPSMPMMNGSS